MLDLSIGKWDSEKERKHHDWIAVNPSGLVLNLKSNSGPSGSLHSSLCKSMIYKEAKSRGPRFCFESEAEFVKWLMEKKLSQSDVYQGCPQCSKFRN